MRPLLLALLPLALSASLTLAADRPLIAAVPAPAGAMAPDAAVVLTGAPAERVTAADLPAPTRSGDAPVAIADAYVIPAGETLAVAAENGLLLNDFDAEGDALTAISYTLPPNGDVGLTTTGSFEYTPDPGFTGNDTFVYSITDGTSVSAAGTVTITVLPASNRAPVATADHYTVSGGETLDVAAVTGLLHNDVDPDGDPLTVLSYQVPANGDLSVAADGSFSYTPDPGFEGTETVIYGMTDGSETVTGELVLVVTPPTNRAPVAQTDWYYTPAGTELAIAAFEGLLRNDLDPDGDPLSVIGYQVPANGDLGVAADGSFQYQPDAGFEGTDVSVHTIVDGTTTSTGELRLIVGIYGGIATGVITPPRPGGFALHEPSPNPFNPRTQIAFRTEATGHVQLRVLDLRGRVIATLVDDQRPAGEHTAVWDGRTATGGRAASGTYVAELRSGAQRAVQKLTLVK